MIPKNNLRPVGRQAGLFSFSIYSKAGCLVLAFVVFLKNQISSLIDLSPIQFTQKRVNFLIVSVCSDILTSHKMATT